jgi:KipI family sensor histidine kinase inhibitor
VDTYNVSESMLDSTAEIDCKRVVANALKIKFYGERSLLLSKLSFGVRLGMEAILETGGITGLLEWVSGYDTLLLIFESAHAATVASEQISDFGLVTDDEKASGRLIKIPVEYSGVDLESVAKQVGLSVGAVIERHAAPEYRVRMMGFMPGFPYLDGLDPVLHLPRRGSPRDRIEPGTVAIGGPHAGIYSVASPGGWHLLGKTQFVLFDLGLASGKGACGAFKIKVGDRVRFVPKEVNTTK